MSTSTKLIKQVSSDQFYWFQFSSDNIELDILLQIFLLKYTLYKWFHLHWLHQASEVEPSIYLNFQISSS